MEISLNKLGKTYDGHRWAVRGLDLRVPRGSIFGFIGPNGAGKSTTLKMIATVMEPTEGQVRLNDLDSRENSRALRAKIGFLGDGSPLYKHMTPREYLRFFGQCYEMPTKELEMSIAETLEVFSLQDKADVPSENLSKGMRQRLLIARCLLHRPELLLLDEPADGLDPRARSELRTILHRVRDRGTTLMISSHILRELDDLCDRVAIIQRGRVVVAGEVSDIVERYEVRRFVYEIRLLSGTEKALEILAGHRALVEECGEEEGLARLRVQVQGGEPLMAEILASLVRGGVPVVTVSRQRSRLEDIYNRISDDRVN